MLLLRSRLKHEYHVDLGHRVASKLSGAGAFLGIDNFTGGLFPDTELPRLSVPPLPFLHIPLLAKCFAEMQSIRSLSNSQL